MAAQQLVELIDTLSPEQQHAVEEFIAWLKTQNSPILPSSPLSFRTALDSFVREHSDLLHRLAQ